MKVLLFGKLSEILGREVEVDLPAEAISVADLRRLLARLHPAAEAALMSPMLRACIDDDMAADETRLTARSEVAFFPPLSGG